MRIHCINCNNKYGMSVSMGGDYCPQPQKIDIVMRVHDGTSPSRAVPHQRHFQQHVAVLLAAFTGAHAHAMCSFCGAKLSIFFCALSMVSRAIERRSLCCSDCAGFLTKKKKNGHIVCGWRSFPT